MADTIRKKSEIIALMANNVTGAVSAQDNRDFVESTMGSKERTTVALSTYTLLDDDEILHVTRSATGVCTITIPTALITDNRVFNIKDAGFNASNYNITVETQGSEKIENSTADYIINSDGDSVQLYSDGIDLFIR